MNAIQVLMAAQAAGVAVTAEGNDLVLNASTAPPQAVVRLLAQNKSAVLALLQHVEEGDDDLRAAFDERAAIVEHEGGLPRAHAEVLAAISVAPARIADEARGVVIAAAARFLERMLQS